MCLFIPVTHSKKNMIFLQKYMSPASTFVSFPLFLSGFTALSEQEPGHPLLRNFQESPPAGQGAQASRLMWPAPSFHGGQRPLALGVGLKLCRTVGSEQVQAAPTDLSLPSASAFLGIILPNQNDFQCYFLTKYHLSALRM